MSRIVDALRRELSRLAATMHDEPTFTASCGAGGRIAGSDNVPTCRAGSGVTVTVPVAAATGTVNRMRGATLDASERDELRRLADWLEQDVDAAAAELVELDLIDEPTAAVRKIWADIWVLRVSAQEGRRLWQELSPPLWGAPEVGCFHAGELRVLQSARNIPP